jgi:hypothetical protein
MISPVSNAVQAAPVEPAVAPQPSSSAKPQAAPTDSVQISNTAKAMLQEALENSVQTAKEAAGGDVQAQRLLAREAAAHRK